MEIIGGSVDDVLMELYEALPSSPRNVASRGETHELLGVALRIKNPRARLSRSENRGKSFSALGELLWYLSGHNDAKFIQEYVPAYKNDAEADGTIHGGYGPRLFAMRGSVDQIQSVTELLTQKPPSRRAVTQLFNAEDIAAKFKEAPCTTTMQFFNRDAQLHMAVTLRSNDAYRGLPHDIFCFTMLQEMMARRLGVELGEYYTPCLWRFYSHCSSPLKHLKLLIVRASINLTSPSSRPERFQKAIFNSAFSNGFPPASRPLLASTGPTLQRPD